MSASRPIALLRSACISRGAARRAIAAATAGRAVCAALLLALAGCASLPSNVQRPVSHADTSGSTTALGRIADASLAGADAGHSGFQLLPEGEQAFQARLTLIGRAERSLDIQYYLIANDGTGRQFLDALRDAASRGVRVRILVDDLYATGEDDIYAALAALPNVDVRMFNPLAARGSSFSKRIARSLNDLGRINHRMHNKLFIADGSFAIIGGRNMADEYFGHGATANFIDMDTLAAGPVVNALAAVFDQYWNSDRSYPIASLVGGEPAPRPTSAAVADTARSAGPAGEAAEPGTLAAQFSEGQVDLIQAAAEVLADQPQKTSAQNGGRVTAGHLHLIASAQSEVLLASPYFVPGKPVLEALSAMASTGKVRVSVLTNSLAATDEPVVHLGYVQNRVALLHAGVALHELLPSADVDEDPDQSPRARFVHSSTGRLHGKLAVIDRKSTFIGSMNMDHRSENSNTEDGLIIHSEAIAAQVAAFLRNEEANASYELKLDKAARMSWVSGSSMTRVETEIEVPDGDGPGFALRLVAKLARGML